MNIDKLVRNITKSYLAKDILGQPININDAVVYTVGTKDSGLRRGIVLNITENEDYAEIMIDTCKRNVYDNDILVINDLLRLQGISQESLINEMSLKLKENKNIYLFYVINPNEDTDGIIFFQPQYSKEKGFASDYCKLYEKYPDIIFIPFAKDYQILNINNNICNKCPSEKYNTYNLYDKLDYEHNYYMKKTRLNFNSKMLLSFDLNKFKNTKFEIPINEILTFDINKDADNNEYYLDINNESFTNNLFNHSQFTVESFIYQILFYWNEFVPFMDKYLLNKPDNLIFENIFNNYYYTRITKKI